MTLKAHALKARRLCEVHPQVELVVLPSSSSNIGLVFWGCAVCLMGRLEATRRELKQFRDWYAEAIARIRELEQEAGELKRIAARAPLPAPPEDSGGLIKRGLT